MSTETIDIRVLAAAVRDDSKLTPRQRECLAGLLQSVALAPRAEQRYPGPTPEDTTVAEACGILHLTSALVAARNGTLMMWVCISRRPGL